MSFYTADDFEPRFHPEACRRAAEIANTKRDTEIERLRLENDRLRESARLVDYTQRSRGYPIPKEWDEVVRVARAALKGDAK